MSIRFECECGRVLKASDDQAGLEGQCPVCGRVVTIPHAEAFDPKTLEGGLLLKLPGEQEPVEEAAMQVEDLNDLERILESGEDDRPEKGSWVRSSRFAMLASIVVVVLVALVVFMVVRREKETGEELVVIKEIQPLVESEEETAALPVGAQLEEEEESFQFIATEPSDTAMTEDEPIEEASVETPVVEEPESLPTEVEEEVVASIAEETPPAKEKAPIGAYTINVASFKKIENARHRVDELKKMGLDAFDWEIDIPQKGRWYRVSVGGFATRREAENYVNELRQKGITDTFVTRGPGAS
jgi:cell division septation protein DedD